MCIYRCENTLIFLRHNTYILVYLFRKIYFLEDIKKQTRLNLSVSKSLLTKQAERKHCFCIKRYIMK